MDQDEARRLMGMVPDAPLQPPGPTRMMMVTPQGNTIVRDFPRAPRAGAWGPEGRWAREGVVLEPGTPEYDRERSTPEGQAFGNTARYGTAATMQDMATIAPMAIPGLGWLRAGARVAAGFDLGTLADAGARGLMGAPQDPMGSLRAGLVNAGAQLTGEVIPPAVQRLAKPFAKASLGNALPGMENALLAAKTPTSGSLLVDEAGKRGVSGGLGQDQAFIDQQLVEKAAAIASWPRQFSSAQIQRAIKHRRYRAEKSDLLSTADEEALSNALSVLRSKAGGYTKVTPSSLVGPNGKPLPPTITKVPPRRLSASELDEINKYAEGEAKRLFKARTENNDTKAAPLEGAYKALADVTNEMIHSIPAVAKADAAMHGRIMLRDAKHDALQRAHGMAIPALVATHSIPATAISHDPMWLAYGAGAGALTAALRSPSGLSRMAFAANDPLTRRLLMTAPRAGATFLPDATSTRRREPVE